MFGVDETVGGLTDVIVKAQQRPRKLFCQFLVTLDLVTDKSVSRENPTFITLHNNPYPGPNALVDKLYVQYKQLCSLNICQELTKREQS